MVTLGESCVCVCESSVRERIGEIPSPCLDELEPEAIVVLGRTAMAESGRGGGTSREHRANPRSVGIVGGDCGSD